jgi:glyoxylase-like metal-dependent hydrolase (beta-lactamase superfamily II)
LNICFPISALIRAPARLVDRTASWRPVDFPIRYGLIDHAREGLILIDTGYSDDLYRPRSVRLAFYRAMLRPVLDPRGDAAVQLARRGARLEDVRHVIVSHLHADHICGLGRFPNATIHASAETLRRWACPSYWHDARTGLLRPLLPNRADFACRTLEYGEDVDLPWGGQGHDIFGDGSMISVDLPGHMNGHIGVFFAGANRPLLYAVDTAWTLAGALREPHPTWPARFVIADHAAARRSAAVVKAAHAQGIAIQLCHDPEQAS